MPPRDWRPLLREVLDPPLHSHSFVSDEQKNELKDFSKDVKDFRRKCEQVISKLTIDCKGVAKETMDAVMENYRDKFEFKTSIRNKFCKQMEFILNPRVVS